MEQLILDSSSESRDSTLWTTIFPKAVLIICGIVASFLIWVFGRTGDALLNDKDTVTRNSTRSIRELADVEHGSIILSTFIKGYYK